MCFDGISKKINTLSVYPISLSTQLRFNLIKRACCSINIRYQYLCKLKHSLTHYDYSSALVKLTLRRPPKKNLSTISRLFLHWQTDADNQTGLYFFPSPSNTSCQTQQLVPEKFIGWLQIIKKKFPSPLTPFELKVKLIGDEISILKIRKYHSLSMSYSLVFISQYIGNDHN